MTFLAAFVNNFDKPFYVFSILRAENTMSPKERTSIITPIQEIKNDESNFKHHAFGLFFWLVFLRFFEV